MKALTKNDPASESTIQNFESQIDFTLPKGLIEFYSKSDGAELKSTDGRFYIIWPLAELFRLNEDYNVSTYAPKFFIFGSDGGDSAYCIAKGSGAIYEIPFIGMSDDEAKYLCRTFDELLEF
jgi:hypothetical protein